MHELRHESAMVPEVLQALGVKPGGVWSEGTVDGGGHAEAILQASAPDGLYIGIDADASMLPIARSRLLPKFGDRVVLLHGLFSQLDMLVASVTAEKIDGVLADLGPSRIQLLDPERGFTLMEDAPLDARYDRNQPFSAWHVVNRFSRKQLVKTLALTGKPRTAGRIAEAIIRQREKGAIDTTGQLREIIYRVLGRRRRGGVDAATEWFWAIRVATNNELQEAEKGIEAAMRALKVGGRLVILSWDGTTHKVVRNKLRELARGCICPPELPCTCGRQPLVRLLYPHGLQPSQEERQRNPSTRSCRLFAAEKIREYEA